MGRAFAQISFTPTVKAIQEREGSRRSYARMEADGVDPRDLLGPDEAAFILERDGFYQATVSENGWPYMQFRGGSPGFIHVIDPHTLAYADLRGNKQYLSAGNLQSNDRMHLFFMDYAHSQRLKVWGHGSVSNDSELMARLTPPGEHAERAIVITVAAFDWNCPQHIPQRFTLAELETMDFT
jgi:predicted pyridoxine 5'-phosphate oxidase superfamily flavin-nucleotide-binding protein